MLGNYEEKLIFLRYENWLKIAKSFLEQKGKEQGESVIEFIFRIFSYVMYAYYSAMFGTEKKYKEKIKIKSPNSIFKQVFITKKKNEIQARINCTV